MAKQKTTLTEFKIQNILFHWLMRKRGHTIAIPNTYAYDWEADLISVTAANFMHEYEVKISRSDFKADTKKVRKHQTLLEATDNEGICPSYFWYVVPMDMITVDEVPDYAGLIYIGPRNKPIVKKKAPKLSKAKATDKQISKLLRGSLWRYWAMREKVDEIHLKYHGVSIKPNE